MGGIVVQKFDHPVMRNLIIAIFRQIGLCCHRCGEGSNQVRVEAVVTSSVLVFLFKVFPPNLSQLYFLSNSMPVKTPLTKNIHCDRKRIFYQELKISVIIALTTTILGKMYIAGLFIIVYCYCSHTYYSLLLLFTDLLLFIVIVHKRCTPLFLRTADSCFFFDPSAGGRGGEKKNKNKNHSTSDY